jgi:hypothetical protein
VSYQRLIKNNRLVLISLIDARPGASTDDIKDKGKGDFKKLVKKPHPDGNIGTD